LMKLSFSSFSVNNCTVHVTTLVMRIKIQYSGFHTNGFSQDTHICFTHFAQYFQDIIYWTQPIKTSSFCEKKIILLHHFHKTNNNNNLIKVHHSFYNVAMGILFAF
jgi:hypothetical protein